MLHILFWLLDVLAYCCQQIILLWHFTHTCVVCRSCTGRNSVEVRNEGDNLDECLHDDQLNIGMFFQFIWRATFCINFPHDMYSVLLVISLFWYSVYQIGIDDTQFVFMKVREPRMPFFIVRQMPENFRFKDEKLCFGFLDLTKAFDRVPRGDTLSNA